MSLSLYSDKINYSPPNMISYCRRMHSSLAMKYIASGTHLQIRITLQTNKFTASNKRVLCWGQTLLVVQTNTFRAGDEHLRWTRMHWKRMFELQPHTHIHTHTHTHTHTASYQRLPNRICRDDCFTKFIVTATYLQNGHYHVKEIQTVSRSWCTTASSVALNWF